MKRIILTGASDGLGKCFGELCIKDNIEVIALCRTKPSYDCIFIHTDLTNEQSMINACNIIKQNYSNFDALINCAGVPGTQEPNKITYDILDATMKINSIAPMFLSSLLFDLIKSNTADIINVGSTIGLKQGYSNQLAYTTSKWALRGTSFNLQLELANTKSRVIQLNVGGMNTRMHEKYTGNKIKNPNEWMKPEDIANIMLYTLKLPKQIEISEIVINRKK